MALRKRSANRHANARGGVPTKPSGGPVVLSSALTNHNALIVVIAITVGLAHGFYLHTMFENDLFFSSLSPLERELSFRTEMGLYYSYYKTLVNADSVLDGLVMLTNDNSTEYPSTINTLQRFNLYPEVVVGLAYRAIAMVLNSVGTSGKHCYTISRGRDLPPVEACSGVGDQSCFYLWCVFALNGFLPSFIFLTATHLSNSVLGGCFSVVMFFYNHGEATRVMWTPPLRESFALPFFYLQLLFLSRVLRSVQPALLDYLCLCLATICFIVPWQFSPFALLTQTLSLIFLHIFRLVPVRKFTTILLCLFVAFFVNVFLQFGSTLLVSSFFPTSLLAGLLLSSFAPTFDRIPSPSLRMFLELFAGLLITILSKIGADFVLGNSDDAHITTILLSKLTSYSDFHTQLYSCSAEFDFLPLQYLLNLTTTLVLPISLIAMGSVLWSVVLRLIGCKYLGAICPERVYHVIQCIAFSLMAFLIMRLKVFLTPQLVLLSSLIVKFKGVSGSQRIPILVLAVLLFSSFSGVSNIQHQLSIVGEFSAPHKEQLINWVVTSTNQNAVFAGAMPIMATIKLCTGRPIVNHPHYEDSGLRQRTRLVYTVYSRKPALEVAEALRSLGVSHVVVEEAWCHKSYREGCWFGDVWDMEDTANVGRPMFCELVEKGAWLSGFKEVFRNHLYVVLKLED